MSNRPAVFLSASIPERKPFTNPQPRSFAQETSAGHLGDTEPPERIERHRIRESVIALVGVCRELGYDLVFGGHPAITPLVHHAAKSLGYDDSIGDHHPDQWNVVIFQALYFKDKFPADVQTFLNQRHRLFHGTPVVPTERDPDETEKHFKDRERRDNISAMRDEMIDHWPGHYVAGVFIGGMDGILDEFSRFRQSHPHALVLPISSTGGATEMGWPEKNVPPLLYQIPVGESGSRQSRRIELLQRDGSEPEFVTYRTLLRMLLE